MSWLSLLRTVGIGLINWHASTVQHQNNWNDEVPGGNFQLISYESSTDLVDNRLKTPDNLEVNEGGSDW